MKRLSIIVPFYNVEKYIEECIRSLYNQDIPQEEYEVICVDDASPDGSRAIVERLQQEYKNLCLVTNERNMKLGGARNTGIKSANGQYILFVDSDDYLVPNCFRKLISEMDITEADYILFNNCVSISDVCKPSTSDVADTDVISGPDLFFSKQIRWSDQIVAWNKIYKTDFIRQNDLYFLNDIMFEDNDYAFRVAAFAKRCKYINYAPYIYRINNESVTHSKVKVENLLFWQIEWKQFFAIKDLLKKQDERFACLIDLYLQQDVLELIKLMRQLKHQEVQIVKKAMSIVEWWRIICLFSLKKRIMVTIQLLTI